MRLLLKVLFALMSAYCLYNFWAYWQLRQKARRYKGRAMRRMDGEAVFLLAVFLLVFVLGVTVFAKF